MDSLYDDEEAEEHLARYGKRWGEDLALRVYTSRLLGADPALVLHGGGNTSVKSQVVELLGDTTDVLYVKGSGSDLATIEPGHFPACRLGHLRRCCERMAMTDEEMVGQLRGQMIDPSSPTPSVEALLHAYLPAKFVEHTHADAVLALVDQPDSAALVREVYGELGLFVPYVMPGFALARRVAELWRAQGDGAAALRVMILDKHGVFTWGDTARESYERMIAAVGLAERRLEDVRVRSSRRTITAPAPTDTFDVLGPALRGALGRRSGMPWLLSPRATPQIATLIERDDLDEVSQIGCATPDHVIRTKATPLVVRGALGGDGAAMRAAIEAQIDGYVERYHAYFKRCSGARGVSRTELDPYPRVFLFPGFGAVTAGRTRAEADVAADVYEHTAAVIEAATALGVYRPVSELDLFDVEYWSLEQAKLKKTAQTGALAGRIALVTGAGGGIGLATADAMLAAGAHVLLTDRDGEALEEAWTSLEREYRGRTWHAKCDVISYPEVRRAVSVAAHRFGGLDIVVSNAGGAWTGALHTAAGDAALRASMDVNLLGHQNVARAASEVLVAQGTGGALLFNASKSAFNQGPDFGPYAVPKAALVALMRQYAIDLAPSGIRANALNADRVRTDLFKGGMLEARAKARGVALDEYFRGNLLKRETTVHDVAEAFVYLATAAATTGCVVTVDGGNAAAFPR